MTNRSLCLPLSLILVAGCESESTMLNSKHDIATQPALRRGRFEMNCPVATSSILSREVLQPVAWRGFEHAEYTVGLEGCGQRRSYVVLCPLTGDSRFTGYGGR